MYFSHVIFFSVVFFAVDIESNQLENSFTKALCGLKTVRKVLMKKK